MRGWVNAAPVLVDPLTIALIAGGALAFLLVRRPELQPVEMPSTVTLDELTRSATASREGIDNTPTSSARANLEALAAAIVAPLRRAIEAEGEELRITSGYRSPELNAKIGGSSRSQHVSGQAVDITATGYDAEELAKRIDGLGLPYDQLIYYAPSRGGHVHVSHRASGGRRMVLYAPSSGGYERRSI
jgi:D-alanyl-D-alanine dipeptidase